MKKESVNRILITLKMRGEATLALLASELKITKEGARQHLNNLIDAGLVSTSQRSEGVGRPTTYYSLTEKGVTRFPDTHAQVTVDLLNAVKNLLGDQALDLLISDRERQTYTRYEQALSSSNSIESRLEKLRDLRTEEGYMAEWKKENETYYFIENHCPICAAATACQGFCRAELQNFIKLLGPKYEIKRTQHILAKDRRCVYEIKNIVSN
ncbi:helix-turn-helix transcriptional regulator [Sphingobacterium faecale]|uniref:Transcriptional regulator n=1 Tax=Sphingobacterium faecale TaxID=2803775 RepID=A0ABS1R029_9SPHI|nr:metalloregulator ArsR/SmtB family transcription factor [Sphingobacterium faecale]MBL1408020.1 transcriptional regulator [Sphingobacterium faecale]